MDETDMERYNKDVSRVAAVVSVAIIAGVLVLIAGVAGIAILASGSN